MISVVANVGGETGTIINIKVDGINITIIYVDGSGNVKTQKYMYVPGIILATEAVVA